MFTTYFASTTAANTIQESQELSQSILTAAGGMELSATAASLQVYKFLETDDPFYRQAYQRHINQFREHALRFQALAQLSEWREAGLTITNFHKKLDEIGTEIMSRHAQRAAEPQTEESRRANTGRLLDLQQQITSTIGTRIRPSLARYVEDSRNSANTQTIRVLLVAGGMSLALSLIAVVAGRFVRQSIVTPIQKLAKGADAVATGDLDHRVIINTNDEYSDLAKNFNHMVDQLQGTTVSKTLHEEQETQLRTLLDGVRDYAIFSIDDQGFVTKWNQASTRILGYEAKDMQGVSFARIFKDDQHARLTRDEGLLAIASRGHFETDTALQRKDGEVFDANMVVTPFSADGGIIKGYSVVVRDITERIKAERHIEQLATKDTLTGLSNRSMLMEQMHTAIARAERSQTQLVVMFIDLDHFKAVNDTLGHAAGDELLRECAKRLTECVREVDIVARLGGDEFVVLLTDVTDTAIVSPIADRMLKLLTTPYQLQGHEASTSASIGICFYPTDGNDVTALMKNADIAMYHAKELNRNNYQFYAEEMNQRMLRRLQLERELRAAVENNEFVLHYQPQVIVATGEIRGAESLLRWNHPIQGLLSPTGFISVAEETGLILPLGEWILNEACRTIKLWRENGIGIPYVVVNVSAAQLSDDLVTSVREALVNHDIEAGWLMLEITETMLMERVEEAISILRRIRELGIRIAMDDFGTGYSSLSVLQRLPLDTLKIDRSFVIAIDDEVNNSRAVAIIGAIIAIAKELNLSVVAEGVDSPTQLAFLRTLNCDTYQGFLYSKPLDAATLELRYAAPVKSVLEDDDGRAITMTTKVTLELPIEVQ
ncbi:MAG: EAL domain-containing protein [Burkholderiales bacterium]